VETGQRNIYPGDALVTLELEDPRRALAVSWSERRRRKESRTPVNVTEPRSARGLGIERLRAATSRNRFLLSRWSRAGAVRAYFSDLTLAWFLIRDARRAGLTLPVYMARELEQLRGVMLAEQARRRLWLSEVELHEAVMRWIDEVHA
jgi:hypothetical protein